jgi:hypothetical protein
MRKLVTSTVSKPSFKCLANEEVTDRLYPGIMRVCVCVADLYEGEWDYTGQRVERNVCGRRPDAASRRRGRPCCYMEGCKNTVRSFRFCLIQSLVDGDVVEHPFGGCSHGKCLERRTEMGDTHSGSCWGLRRQQHTRTGRQEKPHQPSHLSFF